MPSAGTVAGAAPSNGWTGSGGASAGRLAVAGVGGSHLAADSAGASARAGTDGRSDAGASAGGSAGLMPGSTNSTTGGKLVREANPSSASIRQAGEYAVKSYTEAMGLVGGTAYGDAAIAGDGSELYYPEGATPPFASVVIVPGFTAQRSDIAAWGSFLASHGIVTLAIDTNTVGDLPDVRAAGLLDALESLKKENLRPGSPVEGRLDTTRMGVMGWSMGGGGTWIAADSHPELKVAVSLCGWSVQRVGGATSVPSLQLAVQDDELAAGMSQPVYQAIPDRTPKMILEFARGGHWVNNNPANEGNQVGAYGLSWIKVFLEGDERYREFLKIMPSGASDYRTNQ